MQPPAPENTSPRRHASLYSLVGPLNKGHGPRTHPPVRVASSSPPLCRSPINVPDAGRLHQRSAHNLPAGRASRCPAIHADGVHGAAAIGGAVRPLQRLGRRESREHLFPFPPRVPSHPCLSSQRKLPNYKSCERNCRSAQHTRTNPPCDWEIKLRERNVQQLCTSKTAIKNNKEK